MVLPEGFRVVFVGGGRRARLFGNGLVREECILVLLCR